MDQKKIDPPKKTTPKLVDVTLPRPDTIRATYEVRECDFAEFLAYVQAWRSSS